MITLYACSTVRARGDGGPSRQAVDTGFAPYAICLGSTHDAMVML